MTTGADLRRAERAAARASQGAGGARHMTMAEERVAERLARRGRRYRLDAAGKRVPVPYTSGNIRAMSYADMKDGSYV